MTILIILMFPFYYIHVPHTFSTNPDGRLEDVFYAWEEIKDVPTIALALSGTVVRFANCCIKTIFFPASPSSILLE